MTDDQLAALASAAEEHLSHLSDDALDQLWEDLSDLPAIDSRLWVRLPGGDDPSVQRIQRSIARGALEPDWEALRALDSPHRRTALADAVVALRDEGRLHPDEAAYALFDLHTNRPSRLVTASVLAAVAAAMSLPVELAA
jgi:hypothetical protein